MVWPPGAGQVTLLPASSLCLPLRLSYDCSDNRRKKGQEYFLRQDLSICGAQIRLLLSSHTLACAHMLVYCGVRLSTKITENKSESVSLLPSLSPQAAVKIRRLSHMSVWFWLCCSWLHWVSFFLSLWSPLRGLRTPTTNQHHRRSTTAGSPCHQNTYPTSSTTTRKSPSNAAWTHSALLK